MSNVKPQLLSLLIVELESKQPSIEQSKNNKDLKYGGSNYQKLTMHTNKY